MSLPSPARNKDAPAKSVPGSPVADAMRGGNRFTAIISLLRPKQWVKNLFCLAGVVFGAKAGQPAALTQALEVFCAFSATASAMYVFNDLMDRESDARHQQKRFRPIASGAVSPRKAAGLGVLCAMIAVIAVAPLGMSVAAIILVYALLSMTYTLWLKRFPLLDVMFIAAGFLLRIFAGTEAVHVPASAWILLCTLFLSLFLGFAKRRAEMTSHGDSGESREVLLHYSVPLLNRFCFMFATLSMAAYAIFTTSNPQQRTLILTCPLVIYGILRYLWLMERHEGHEQIEVTLFRDRPIQITILLWVALHLAVIYGGLRLNIQ